MDIKEVKTSIEGLEIGMFISRLDKPWIETPYLMEGKKIGSKDDILTLRKYCNYVYVDVNRGLSPKKCYFVVANKDELASSRGDVADPGKHITNEYNRYRQCVYETSVELGEELKTSKKLYNDVSERTQVVFDELKKSKKLDIVSLKRGIKATVDSIIRNPSAFMLLVQIRKTGDYSYSHALGTSVWCAQFGRHLGLKREDIDTLALGGMLLDVGKLQLPESLTKKTSKFTPKDMDIYKRHVSLGVKLLTQVKNIERSILQMVATHHERADGSGYQLGITIDKIPLFGRIAGIVDSYDAMTTERVYVEKTMNPHESIAELYNMRGKQFQAELVEQFIQTVGLYPTGSLVELNTGEVGVVIEINDLKRLYPTIVLLLDKNKQPYDTFHSIDLSQISDMMVEKGLEPGAYGIKMDELFL